MAERLKKELDGVREDMDGIRRKLEDAEEKAGDAASEALDRLDAHLMEISGNISSGKYRFPRALDRLDDALHDGVEEAGRLLREARREALGKEGDRRLLEALRKSDEAIEDAVNRLRKAME